MNKNKEYGGIAVDTETTGLDSSVDEILQVSIVDENGFAIYNAFFKPRNHTEWAEAEKVNHITPEMVRNCPDISGSVATISRVLASAEKIIGYNTPFDLGFLAAAGVEIPADAEIVDVMQMFAEIKGDWDEVHNGLKWHKLTECAEYYGYKWGGTAHDSFQDARATMFCYKRIVNRNAGRVITHELKIRPEYFKAVVLGDKMFEIRKNDRDFRVGDIIVLHEWDEERGYTGKHTLVDITYVLTDTEFVKEGFAVLGIKLCSARQSGSRLLLLEERK